MKLRRGPRSDDSPHEDMAPSDKSGVEALAAAVGVIVLVLVVFWILTLIVF
jgi:hypothetical protein